ncbi:hypothetical protein JTB14_036169 [Gonioctena quinquepunctata]|nr:hypothetical protein JTB14_036169 [Gonioctena quinquepunctata]
MFDAIWLWKLLVEWRRWDFLRHRVGTRSKMRLAFVLTVFFSLRYTESLEKSWTWTEQNQYQGIPKELDPEVGKTDEYLASPSELEESFVDLNSTVERVVDEIITSTREGRALQEYDEIYSDPNVQDALQKGDDGEARNVIKDRLCYLGLMQCENGEQIEGKRPYISPDELVYAQPVAINPVGKPIPTIPLKGSLGSSGKYFSPNKFIPPQSGYQGKPPRRHYGPPPTHSRPFLGKPGLSGEIYAGPFSKPIGTPEEFVQPIEPDFPPYKFEQGEHHSAQHKDKRVEITVNAQGGTASSGVPTTGNVALEHVHHHYHHNIDGTIKPTNIANPLSVAAASVSTSSGLGSSTFNSQNSFAPFEHINTLNKPNPGSNLFGGSSYYSSSNANGLNIGSSAGTYDTKFGVGINSGYYGGQSVANYGSSSLGVNSFESVKPVSEHYGPGSYGTSGLYKKELDLNSVAHNHLQSGYADRFRDHNSQISDSANCICVPYEQCPLQDVIGRKNDLYLPLDPRNLKSDIEAIVDESDNNSTSNVVKDPIDTPSNSTGEAAAKDTDAVKRISKREVDVEKTNEDKPETRQYGSLGSIDMKKIKPTFGISFSLPQQGGGGYPINPYGPNPFVNPYGGAIGPTGINLGLVSLNPLISLQVSKDDYGQKEIKPFVNLHVTPNNFLINKLEDFLSHKKANIFNKHKHYHIHKVPHHYSYPTNDLYLDHTYNSEQDHQFTSPHISPQYSHKDSSDYADSYAEYDPNFIEQYSGVDPNNLFHQYDGRSYGHITSNVDENSLSKQFGRVGRYAINNPSYDHDQIHESIKNNSKKSLDEISYNKYSKGFDLNTPIPIKFPSRRRRRDLNQKKSVKTIDQRQFNGGFEGSPQICKPRHVCCRKPLYQQSTQAHRQCGTRNSQGINGRIKNPVYVDGDSEFGEYPWQVAILKKDPKESVYVCGGTLIDSLHIITAAHCVKTYTGFDLRVRLGEWDVNHDVEFYPYIERDIGSVHIHPEFYAGTLYNDIAILRMDKSIDWSKHPHISPACLPNPYDDYTGSRCWTTGWGKDAFGDFGKYQNILKEVDVPVIGNGICQRQLQGTRLGYDFKLHPGFICAGGEEGKDACKGDGGGPMVCEKGSTWQVVGVVSWGIGCGQNGVPGVYVKVAHYLDWIKQVTQRY